MPVQYRDYYETLGVSRTATQDEIRAAFRQLARKYHPDVATDKKLGEEKFKEINEAYEVLSEPEKRRKYDELGPNWQQGQEFRPEEGSAPEWQYRAGPAGADFHFDGTGFSDFFEAMFGRRGSFGGHRFTEAEGGPVNGDTQFGLDVEADFMVSLEEALKGATRQIRLEKPSGPSGKSTIETLNVKIPPGIREGQRIRLPGKGQNGGDLFLIVHLERHPDFRVQDSDLYSDLEIAPWEAVLGDKIMVPTLGGRVKLTIPPGTQNGQKFRLPNLGLPRQRGKRGDHYISIKIQTPSEIGANERALWQQLAAASKFKPRRSGP